MARRIPYTNFHDLNLDWIIKRIQNVYNDENPPPYPVRTVNGQVGNVHLTGDDIPVSPNDNTEVSTALASKYVKPSGGIPKSDLSSALQTEINSKYVKPSGGIPKSDLSSGVQLDLDAIADKLDEPAVPGQAGQVLTSDGLNGQSWETPVDPATIIDDNAGYGDTDKTWSAHKLLQMEADIVDLENDKIDKPAQAGTTGKILMLDNSLNPTWASQTAVALDATLTDPTKGAPADLVGELKNAINNTDQTIINGGELFSVGSVYVGRLRPDNGKVDTSAYGARIKVFEIVPGATINVNMIYGDGTNINRAGIGLSNTAGPVDGDTLYNVVLGNTVISADYSYSFVNTSNYKYCYVYFWTGTSGIYEGNSDNITLSEKTMFNQLQDKTFQAYRPSILNNNYSQNLSDLNNAILNMVYDINGCLQSIAHIPNTSSSSATLITFNADYSRNNSTNKSFEIQFLTTTTGATYIRSCWGGTWKEWKELASADEVTAVDYNPFNFMVFSKFGIIGDSLSIGSHTNRNGQTVNDTNKSWGKYLSNQCHNTPMFLGFGGATTTLWIESTRPDGGLAVALDPNNECDAYIIGLGYNDANPNSASGGVVLGSMADINSSDPDLNSVSYYGNMDKILRKLHTAYTNAPLFVLTNPYYNTTYVPNYNTALRDVCSNLGTSNNVHLIDLYDLYNKIFTSLADDREGNHYHPQVYAYMSKLIVTAISNYMLNNVTLFKYAGE